jgi:glycerophosphoryl diester phosphodiesterase
MGKLLKIAHRGYSARYPENTIMAFEQAILAGADMIEFDVHLSKDGVPVVIHDDLIDRTSNGTGFVKDYTLQELREFDFSYLFRHHGPVGIPTLEEVVDCAGERVMLNIEIKNCPMQYEGIEKAILKILREKNCINRAVVSSFDHFSLDRIKAAEGSIRIGVLYSSLWLSFESEIKLLRPYSIHPEIAVCQREQLKWARDEGLAVFPWVAHDRSAALELFLSGLVDGVMVNELNILSDL